MARGTEKKTSAGRRRIDAVAPVTPDELDFKAQALGHGLGRTLVPRRLVHVAIRLHHRQN